MSWYQLSLKVQTCCQLICEIESVCIFHPTIEHTVLTCNPYVSPFSSWVLLIKFLKKLHHAGLSLQLIYHEEAPKLLKRGVHMKLWTQGWRRECRTVERDIGGNHCCMTKSTKTLQWEFHHAAVLLSTLHTGRKMQQQQFEDVRPAGCYCAQAWAGILHSPQERQKLEPLGLSGLVIAIIARAAYVRPSVAVVGHAG